MSNQAIWSKASVFNTECLVEDTFLFSPTENGFTLAFASDDGIRTHEYTGLKIIDQLNVADAESRVFTVMSLIVNFIDDVSYGTMIDNGGEIQILIKTGHDTAALYDTKMDKISDIDFEEDIIPYDELDEEDKELLFMMRE